MSTEPAVVLQETLGKCPKSRTRPLVVTRSSYLDVSITSRFREQDTLFLFCQSLTFNYYRMTTHSCSEWSVNSWQVVKRAVPDNADLSPLSVHFRSVLRDSPSGSGPASSITWLQLSNCYFQETTECPVLFLYTFLVSSFRILVVGDRQLSSQDVGLWLGRSCVQIPHLPSLYPWVLEPRARPLILNCSAVWNKMYVSRSGWGCLK